MGSVKMARAFVLARYCGGRRWRLLDYEDTHYIFMHHHLIFPVQVKVKDKSQHTTQISITTQNVIAKAHNLKIIHRLILDSKAAVPFTLFPKQFRYKAI